MVITNTTTQSLLVAITNTISVVVSVAMLVCWQWPGVVVMLGADVGYLTNNIKIKTLPPQLLR